MERGNLLQIIVIVLLTSLMQLSETQQSISIFDYFLNQKPRPETTDITSNNGVESRQLSLASTQAFIIQKKFNTSCAFTIPLFVFQLPQKAAQGSSVDLANQAVYGLFGTMLTMSTMIVPVLFTGLRAPDLVGRSDEEKGSLYKLITSSPAFTLMTDDLKEKIGLDRTKCLQKTICEAHRHPKNKEYGLLALPFQIFFPPLANGSWEARASSLQLAAREGKYSTKECGDQFNCFFDVLDLANFFVNWYNFNLDSEEYNESINSM